MDRATAYTRQISQHVPNLRIDTVTLNQEGQYSDVLIVNDNLVFRFPKVRAALESMERETLVLQRLQDRITLAIPRPIHRCLEPDRNGEAFVGYPMIPGRPLWRHVFNAIQEPDALDRMAGQLAGFLYELHHVPAEDLIATPLPVADTRRYWTGMYERIRAALYRHMRPDARLKVSAHFDGYLERPEDYGFEPALRHGDFGTGNILVDRQELTVTGIVDFGSVALGDPAVDFAALLACYGPDFYQRCSIVYPAMRQARVRVDFYRGTFALQEALFGIENGDEAAFRAGMAGYV